MLARQPPSHLPDFGPKSPVLTLASLLVDDELVRSLKRQCCLCWTSFCSCHVRWSSETKEQDFVLCLASAFLDRDYWQHMTASVHFLQKVYVTSERTRSSPAGQQGGCPSTARCPGAGVRDADMYPARSSPRDLTGSFPPPQLPCGLTAAHVVSWT